MPPPAQASACSGPRPGLPGQAGGVLGRACFLCVSVTNQAQAHVLQSGVRSRLFLLTSSSPFRVAFLMNFPLKINTRNK